ncbi:MAG: phospholipid carrier-dependent glycosyltransferase, partial [Isosphaeraceae bacterium]
MSDPQRRCDPPSFRHPRLLTELAWITGLACLCTLILGWNLNAEPHFPDESAYFSQSYYARLFVEGAWNDVAWLDYPAYDLPPLPKYLIGGAVGMAGYRWPTPADARAWYGDISRRFEPPGALFAARLPILALGVLGCLAAFGIGRCVSGSTAGTLTAVLLAINPLYRLLSRRAMSDIPCESFTLVALGMGLVAWIWWQRGARSGLALLLSAGSGVAVGLSLLCKMSGLLGLLVLCGWGALGLVASARRSLIQLAAMAGLTLSAAAGTFLMLNPYVLAAPRPPLPAAVRAIAGMSPLARATRLVTLRVEVARGQKLLFPHNAVNTPGEKVQTSLIQGFGRFGLFGPIHSDSTRRYDWNQDAGAPIWLGFVTWGIWCCWREGSRQR